MTIWFEILENWTSVRFLHLFVLLYLFRSIRCSLFYGRLKRRHLNATYVFDGVLGSGFMVSKARPKSIISIRETHSSSGKLTVFAFHPYFVSLSSPSLESSPFTFLVFAAHSLSSSSSSRLLFFILLLLPLPSSYHAS